MPDSTPPRPCAPRARCKDHRHCPICARIRQAKIADAAERLQAAAGRLDWICLSPNEPGAAALAAARAAFLRAEHPAGALWTVEYSPRTGALHCNVIAPSAAATTMRIARVWRAPIAGDPRDVAAYISKREQMPPSALYDGRLYGTAGPLWSYLAGDGALPVVAAAKTQYDLDPEPLLLDSGISRSRFIDGHPMTSDDYRAIAARRLPDILRALPHRQDRAIDDKTEGKAAPTPRRFYRPVLNSRRVRWLIGALRPWERKFIPK